MISRRVKRCNREPRCRVCGWALTLAGAGKWYCSFYCLTTITEEQMDIPESKIITTSMGRAVVVARLELLDSRPEVLAAGLPVLLADELPRFATSPPAERQRTWSARVTACDQYRALKRANPSATVDTPWA